MDTVGSAVRLTTPAVRLAALSRSHGQGSSVMSSAGGVCTTVSLLSGTLMGDCFKPLRHTQALLLLSTPTQSSPSVL